MIGLEGKELCSKRLRYRLLEREDRSVLRLLLADREVTEPAGFYPARTDEEFEEFFKELTAYGTGIGIYLQEQLIGYIHVNRHRSMKPQFQEKNCISFGFVIGKPYQRMGYATETLKTLTEAMKKRFDYCFADHFVGNEASRRVIRNCGYRYAQEYSVYLKSLGRNMKCQSFYY